MFMQEIVSEILSKRGYQVLKAENGLRALDILKTFTPDIFFIDLILPFHGLLHYLFEGIDSVLTINRSAEGFE